MIDMFRKPISALIYGLIILGLGSGVVSAVRLGWSNGDYVLIITAAAFFLGIGIYFTEAHDGWLTAVKEDVVAVKEDVAEITVDVDAVKTDVDTVKKDVDKVKTDVDTVKTNVAEITVDVDQMKNDIVLLKQGQDTIIELLRNGAGPQAGSKG